MAAAVRGGAVMFGALALAAAACGEKTPGNTATPEAPVLTADEGATAGATTSTTTGQHLVAAVYEVHDCVTWEENVAVSAVTRVVPCDQPHRIQISGELRVPDGRYPTDDAWTALIDDLCRAPAEFVLGRPHDPNGRFRLHAIHPLADGWAAGERTMWCGISPVGDPADPATVLTGDAWMADQAIHYAVGDCVAHPPGAWPAVVPCARSHLYEVTGRVDFPDGPAPPDLTDDPGCHEQTVAYLGSDPVEPWRSGYDQLPPESWAAGRRFVHCIVGQWAADDSMVTVTGSARG